MKTGAFVLGYHGCDRDFGEQLLSGKKELKGSNNAWDWLGHGIYFWENNPRRALEWAEFMSRHPKFTTRVRHPFAIGAVIELGNCLDLTESLSLQLVRTAYENLEKTFTLAGIDLPRNRAAHGSDTDLTQRFLDCAVINHLHTLREQEGLESFSTVRAPFAEGEELYPGAKIPSKTHIQFCVRDVTRIRGVFRVTSFD